MNKKSMNDNLGLHDSDYRNFKTLLEYFVAHLELIAATLTVKDDKNLESLCAKAQWKNSDLRKNILKEAIQNADEITLTGQGYKNSESGNRGAIQTQIEQWCNFNEKKSASQYKRELQMERSVFIQNPPIYNGKILGVISDVIGIIPKRV